MLRAADLRVLTTLLLLRANYNYVPYSSLESVIEESKMSYYNSLRKTQRTIRSKTPDWRPWIHFFLNVLLEQKNRLEQKMTHETLVLGKLSTLSLKIVELTQAHGRVTVASLVEETAENRNTIKDHLRSLVKNGHLVLHGAGRGAWYGLS